MAVPEEILGRYYRGYGSVTTNGFFLASFSPSLIFMVGYQVVAYVDLNISIAPFTDSSRQWKFQLISKSYFTESQLSLKLRAKPNEAYGMSLTEQRMFKCVGQIRFRYLFCCGSQLVFYFMNSYKMLRSVPELHLNGAIYK